MDDDVAIATAIGHELRLLSPEVRSDSAALEQLLSPDFSEIGQSGRRWSRGEIIVELLTRPGVDVSVRLIAGRVITRELVLVEYETGNVAARVPRTSLWRRTGDVWQVVLHRATPVIGET